jgi:S1-C subfamily serine protease
VNVVDWVALGFVVLAALAGWRKGLIGSALSAVGIVAGAGVGAVLLETLATLVGNTVRRSLALTPLRPLDAAGGLLLGAGTGLVVVWMAGAVALHFPGQPELRREAQRSLVLQRLNGVVPPARLMEAIERVDPFPSIAGPAAPVEPPDPALARSPAVQRARPSVVRVLGSACGLAVSGTGWVAGPNRVVTAAHVVAGQSDTRVEDAQGRRHDAQAVAFDARNDVAVLRVPGLRAPALRLGDGAAGTAVAILGFPENRPFTAVAGRLGQTATVVTEDARGNGPITRTVTTLRGDVRRGNSGGPAVSAGGRVETTVFAARVGSGGGFGVPPESVRRALAGANGAVSTGPCAP